MRSLIALTLCGMTAGCGIGSAETPTPSFDIRPLPTYEPQPGPFGCAGGQLTDVEVVIDPDAVNPVRLIPPNDAVAESRIVWRPGYRLVVDPPVVIDERGEIVLRHGDVLPAVDVCDWGEGTLLFHGLAERP